LLACGLATARLGSGLQMPATTTRDGTLITLNRFLREPMPEIVLVGSSMTFRLKEEYFATPGLRNLALAGGSPVTGLQIVANQPRLPRVILVEANVLSRPLDRVLIEKYSRANAEPPLFRPVRAAVAGYEHWLHAPLTHEQVALGLRRLLAQPPSDFDNRIYVERALGELNTEDPAEAARTNAGLIERLILTLEQRGVRVLLFELPYAEKIESARAAVVTREIIHGAFPNPDRWLRMDVDRSELRWADGVHLDERSAVLMTQSMERALASVRR
jgi:hypothetical protein